MNKLIPFLLILACGSCGDTWAPPDLKAPPLSVDTSSGKIHITYDPKHCYQHAFTTGNVYLGGTATTEYIEVFLLPLDAPAQRIGWRDRGAIFLYPVQLKDFVSSDGAKVIVRTNGTNFLIVVFYSPHGPDPKETVTAENPNAINHDAEAFLRDKTFMHSARACTRQRI